MIQYLYNRYGADHAAMVCTVITYRARSAVREVAKALGFPLELVDRVAKALDTRDATDVAADLAADGTFGWLFEELGGAPAPDAGNPLIGHDPDSPWHGSGHLVLRPDLAAAESRARDAAGDHDGRPYSESGWVPPRRPSVLDQSVVSVKHEGWEQKRYGPGGLKRVAEVPAGGKAGCRASGPGERHADRGAPPSERAAGRHKPHYCSCTD